MRIPRKINVMGTEYIFKKEKNMLNDNGQYGYCDWKEKIIGYDSDLKGTDLIHTILHEIDHAIRYESGLYQVLSNEVLEIIAETTATQFIRLFDIKFKK